MSPNFHASFTFNVRYSWLLLNICATVSLYWLINVNNHNSYLTKQVVIIILLKFKAVCY